MPATTTPTVLLDDLKPGDCFTFVNGYARVPRRVYIKGRGRMFCRLDLLLTDFDWITYQGPSTHLPVRPVS